MSIQAISSNKGYLDVVNFINNEMANPTVGLHNATINDLVAKIAVQDYYLFLQEIYTDPDVYWGVVWLTYDYKIFVIQNGGVVYCNTNVLDVQTLFLLDSYGLAGVYENRVDLYDIATGTVVERQLEISIEVAYGNQLYYCNVVNNSIVESSGLMQALLTTDQSLSSYNIKIDKTPYSVITLYSRRDSYTQFTVQVTETTQETFSYLGLGQVMYVQDTDISRESVKFLERNEVLFYTLPNA